jgi:hypothetical protein
MSALAPLLAMAAAGCWMHVYSEPGYRGELETYIGPTHGHFALRGEGSLLVGPGARLRGFSDARYDAPRLTLEPGTRVADLLAAGLQNHARSFRLVCVGSTGPLQSGGPLSARPRPRLPATAAGSRSRRAG